MTDLAPDDGWLFFSERQAGLTHNDIASYAYPVGSPKRYTQRGWMLWQAFGWRQQKAKPRGASR